MKKTKKSLVLSIITLLLCSCMFIGSTFAWFTDTVSNTGNKIQAGTLDVGLEQWKITDEKPNGDWFDISGDGKPVFNSGEGIALWEPGYSQYAVLRVRNNGNLALKYKLLLNVNGALELNDKGHSIADAIDVYGFVAQTEDAAEAAYGEETFEEFKAISGVSKLGSLSSFLFDEDGAAYGVLLPNGATDAQEGEVVGSAYAVLCLHMREDAGNEYQGMALGTSFDITLNATQYTYEKDGFNSEDYDALADGTPDHPEFDNPTYPVTNLPIKTTVQAGGTTEVTQEQTIELPSGMKIEYPAGVPLNTHPKTTTPGSSTNKADQGFEFVSEKPAEGSVTVKELVERDPNKAVVQYKLTLPVDQSNNTILIKTIDKIAAGYINIKVFHNDEEIALVEKSATPDVESFYYNPGTGEFVLWVFHSSPIEFVYDIIPPLPALETKEEIKDAMANAESGDTLKIKAGKYYFGEGLTIPEGVKIEAEGEGSADLIIPKIYVGGEDQNYVEDSSSPFIANKTSGYTYGFVIMSSKFENGGSAKTTGGEIQDEKSGWAMYSSEDFTPISGQTVNPKCSLSMKHDECSTGQDNVTMSITFEDDAVYSYTFICNVQ